MAKYVALLRGIAPTNPNMRNNKLRGVFEKLGFENVKTVISSGNVIFESPSRSRRKLEESIEKALPEELGFKSTTIIRSQGQIQKLVDKNPFQGMRYSQASSLNVTFLGSTVFNGKIFLTTHLPSHCATLRGRFAVAGGAREGHNTCAALRWLQCR